ncbi:MAG: hypothetical protein SNF33_04470 [Candidatus Algichlamydia australiensis]|nr:hypothetical protein [Chlamydiales bacterium]
MKKFGLLLLLFTANFGRLKADEGISTYTQDAFVYSSMGSIASLIMFPIVGIGFRNQSGNIGSDISIQGTGIPGIFLAKGNATVLYYPKPNLKRQFYFGAGAGIMTVNLDETAAFSPELVVGKQYCPDTGGRRFFEAQITPYIMNSQGEGTFVPGLILRYGIGF